MSFSVKKLLTYAALTAAITTAPLASASLIVNQYLGYQSNNITNLKDWANTHVADYSLEYSVIDFSDHHYNGSFNGYNMWAAAADTGNTSYQGNNDYFFAHITGMVDIAVADDYTFRTNNDDGAFLFVDGVSRIVDTGYHGAEHKYSQSLALSEGKHSVDLWFFEAGGGADLEFSARRTSSADGYALIGAQNGLQTSNTLSESIEVPEPSTLAIFALGLMGIAARRRVSIGKIKRHFL